MENTKSCLMSCFQLIINCLFLISFVLTALLLFMAALDSLLLSMNNPFWAQFSVIAGLLTYFLHRYVSTGGNTNDN